MIWLDARDRLAARVREALERSCPGSRTASSCYVHVGDADALYRAWSEVGVPADPATGSRLVPPVDTDYRMREFALVDRSGNLVRVGSPVG
ncbi:hypothetical protein F8568_040890 [Actinomadura sp. LD22]|uniref:Glyoxalase-like domain-containing protein n=1 Tax=Actinomadura physcomitrii TaxID=2650748 RepID=A0A6I4MNP6_9ACTN|nr:hypothetical protein [Actinomadura physcomitrii]MWA06600.1 hypothetical protein [Actinomadura physcomitrii]